LRILIVFILGLEF